MCKWLCIIWCVYDNVCVFVCGPGNLNINPEIDMKCTERYKERTGQGRRGQERTGHRLGNTIEKRFGDTIQYTILSSKSLCNLSYCY